MLKLRVKENPVAEDTKTKSEANPKKRKTRSDKGKKRAQARTRKHRASKGKTTKRRTTSRKNPVNPTPRRRKPGPKKGSHHHATRRRARSHSNPHGRKHAGKPRRRRTHSRRNPTHNGFILAGWALAGFLSNRLAASVPGLVMEQTNFAARQNPQTHLAVQSVTTVAIAAFSARWGLKATGSDADVKRAFWYGLAAGAGVTVLSLVQSYLPEDNAFAKFIRSITGGTEAQPYLVSKRNPDQSAKRAQFIDQGNSPYMMPAVPAVADILGVTLIRDKTGALIVDETRAVVLDRDKGSGIAVRIPDHNNAVIMDKVGLNTALNQLTPQARQLYNAFTQRLMPMGSPTPMGGQGTLSHQAMGTDASGLDDAGALAFIPPRERTGVAVINQYKKDAVSNMLSGNTNAALGIDALDDWI